MCKTTFDKVAHFINDNFFTILFLNDRFYKVRRFVNDDPLLKNVNIFINDNFFQKRLFIVFLRKIVICFLRIQNEKVVFKNDNFSENVFENDTKIFKNDQQQP